MLAAILLEEAGPNTELAWMLYWFLGFFFLMVLIGWWVSGRTVEQAEAPHAEEPDPAVSHAETVAPEDLTLLEGIGPKVAKVLNGSGISTFAELARANPAEIQKALSAAGLQMMNPEGWIEQATLAAQGDWEGLKKMQNELKGGRRK